MDELGVADYRNILLAIERLGAADDYESFPARVLDAVATAIEVDFASYSEVDLAGGHNRFAIRPDPLDLPAGSAVRTRFVRRFGNHPIVARQLSAEGDDGRLDVFLDRVRLMGMIGNCCGEAGLTLNLGLNLETADRRLVGLAINRGIRDFDGRDTQRLAALAPHIGAAHRAAMRLERSARPPASRRGTVVGVPLTSREGQVLHWVSMGKTNEEVGIIIGARPLTVKKHLEHIYDKLGVPNRTAAARLVSGSLSQAGPQ